MTEEESDEMNKQSPGLTKKKKKMKIVHQIEEEPQGSTNEEPQGSAALPKEISSKLPSIKKKKRQTEETSDETIPTLQVYHKKGKRTTKESLPTIVENPNPTIVESSNEDAADELTGMADQPEQVVVVERQLAEKVVEPKLKKMKKRLITIAAKELKKAMLRIKEKEKASIVSGASAATEGETSMEIPGSPNKSLVQTRIIDLVMEAIHKR